MKRVSLGVLALALLAACAASESPPALDAQTHGCAAEATGAWRGTQTYTVTASASGPICAHAVAVLVVRRSDGEVFWSDARATSHVFGLADASSPAQMAAALADWVNFASERPQTTADLPPWSSTSGQGGESEFPFAPAPWLDEQSYETMRARAEPVFCYVQGMESLACLTESQVSLDKIGIQSFPG